LQFSYSFEQKKTKENQKKTQRKPKKTQRKPKKTRNRLTRAQGQKNITAALTPALTGHSVDQPHVEACPAGLRSARLRPAELRMSILSRFFQCVFFIYQRPQI
jgi:hypothetical protein